MVTFFLIANQFCGSCLFSAPLAAPPYAPEPSPPLRGKAGGRHEKKRAFEKMRRREKEEREERGDADNGRRKRKWRRERKEKGPMGKGRGGKPKKERKERKGKVT